MEQAMLEQVSPKEAVTPWEAHAVAGFCQDLWTCRDPILEQSIPEGLYPMAGTLSGKVHEELQYVGRTHVEEVCEELHEE